MNPTLLILAAGMGSRYGGLKQLDPVGPSGETLLDYAIFDARRSGFDRVVFVIRHDFEAAFRETIGRRHEGRMAVDYAFQALDDLPEGLALPAGRDKPWGTAHAIRAARRIIRTPFAIINADDFYGRDAFQRMGEFLKETPPAATGRMVLAMAGYRLDRTLSEHGAVARGICRVSADGQLQDVVEMTKIVATAAGAENREHEAAPVALTGRETASMNFWGFQPELMAQLEKRFPVWLRAHAANPKAEWYIPAVVNELVHEGKAVVRVLPTDSPWFGLTYREDRERVSATIRRLVEEGMYPGSLFP